MKRIITVIAGVCLLISCNDKKSENSASNADSSAKSATTVEGNKQEKPDYLKGIKYTQWEIGNPEHIKTALEFYAAWDVKDIDKLTQIFTDTVTLRLPAEREQIVLPNSRIKEALSSNRGEYGVTMNNIVSAVSLHDTESNEDWVTITTYNKWVEKSGKRDSVLYNDNWRFKNGKIDFLMSYDKVPTRTLLNEIDPKK
ncbi:MAG: nuclear transport factor 2 family protein [Chitinophagaceae bacterium]